MEHAEWIDTEQFWQIIRSSEKGVLQLSYYNSNQRRKKNVTESNTVTSHACLLNDSFTYIEVAQELL